MTHALTKLRSLLLWTAFCAPLAQAEPFDTALDPRWAPDSLGTPPRPGEASGTLPEYGEDRHGSLAQDMAAVGGLLGGTIIPMTMTMVKWNETYDERSLELKKKDRTEATELLRTYGLTAAIVAPLTSWTGFMAGGGYRQKSARALLCGIAASAVAYPVGSYLGRLITEPVTDTDIAAQPRFPDRTMFLGSLVWNGIITSATVAGVAVGGGEIIRPTRDPGFTLHIVKEGDQTVWVPGFQTRF
jgi:hypothetical protein